MLETPEFKSEDEEAAWWDHNQEAILREFEQAAQDGTLGHGTLASAGLLGATSIHLDPRDAELARSLAEQRGLGYQAYLEMILHQALAQEAAKGV